MTSRTEIGKLALLGITSCEIDSSFDQLTDTAKIIMPRRLKWRGQSLTVGAGAIIFARQNVSLRLGYDDRNVERFSGLVRSVGAGIPIEIVCEDSLALKQSPVTLSYRDVTLSELLDDAMPVEVKLLADYQLGKLRVSRLTPIQLLDELRKKYGVKAWMRKGVLHAGLAIDAEAQRTWKITWGRNRISDDLQWRRAEDVRIKATGVIILPGGKKLEVVVGDPDGESRTFHYYDLPEADVRKRLEVEMARLRYTGYRGTLTTFLEPAIAHGDVVELLNPELPEQDGRYLVSAVATSFSDSGGRQVLTLETRVQ